MRISDIFIIFFALGLLGFVICVKINIEHKETRAAIEEVRQDLQGVRPVLEHHKAHMDNLFGGE
jgi:hypothetical protein